jgi:NAD+ synthase (glutamine-hydrolysing)
VRPLELRRKVEPRPFVPSDPSDLAARCEEILTIQSAGLEQRLRHIHGRSAVVGLSGGLDSTLALIVAVRTFDRLGIDRSGITAVSMPCFGTTGRTKNNAQQLAQAYGVSFREIPIAQSVRQHFADIGHLESVHDVTYENAQARERTQVLMDIANQTGGIVIGTGDLSELALGWATLQRRPYVHVWRQCVRAQNAGTLSGCLRGAKRTADAGRRIARRAGYAGKPGTSAACGWKNFAKNEELVGPYELHDFFLYYFVRWGFDPAKIYRLARGAFAGVYDNTTILKWLQIFLKRFFAQQFKRSCLPDGQRSVR